MKKIFIAITVTLLSLPFIACGGGKESASSNAKKWCELNGKAFKAPDGAAKDAAKATLDKFEKDMEAKYKDDKAFMDEVGKEVEKCEDASEGK